MTLTKNLVGGLHGGGSPEMERIAILADYDLEEKIRMAQEQAGIGQVMKEGKENVV
jgi:aromatic ring hydroxylase